MLYKQLSQTVLVVRYSMKVSWSVSHIDIHDNFHGRSKYSNVNEDVNEMRVCGLIKYSMHQLYQHKTF